MKNRHLILLVLLLNFAYVFSQEENKNSYAISANINVNNNGISWIPVYSLEKPSVITDFKLTINNFSINPRFRFDIEDLQPWNIDVYLNYKFKKKRTFAFELGTLLPAATFQQFSYENDNGLTESRLTPWMYIFINPKVTININSNLKFRISYFEGFPTKIVSEYQPKNGRTIFIQPLIKKINVNQKIDLLWMPQLYLTTFNEDKGYYFSQNIFIEFKNFPFKISTSLNKAIETELRGKKFDWNIGLSYNFSKKLIEK